MTKEFYTTCEALKESGYTVRLAIPNLKVAFLKGNGVRGFIGEYDANYNGYVDGHIIADNSRCYDKLGRCPLRMKMPATPEQVTELLRQLKTLGSDEGFRISNSFEYLDKSKNPWTYSEEFVEK